MTEGERSIASEALSAVSGAMRALPPAFIALVLLNVTFIAVLFYYLLEQQADRTALLTQVLRDCAKP